MSKNCLLKYDSNLITIFYYFSMCLIHNFHVFKIIFNRRMKEIPLIQGNITETLVTKIK